MRKTFWIRFILWVLFALIIPIIYIFVRTNLFYTINKISVWAFIAIIIVLIFFRSLWKYLKKGVPYSKAVQVISGVVKIILPLIAVFAIVLVIRLKSVEVLVAVSGIEHFLYILIPSEIIAIPLNPMPKWVNDNRDNQLSQFIERIKGE